MQRWFLREIGITDTEAFVHYNFAPPSLRRRIGMMGFVHKRVLGKCHPALCEFLEFSQEQGMNTRNLVSHFDAVKGFARMYNNSLYMYILMYNRLPEEIVSLPSVPSFQTKLNKLAKSRADQGHENWRCAYQNCKDVVDYFYV